jgi:hypothetical protein
MHTILQVSRVNLVGSSACQQPPAVVSNQYTHHASPHRWWAGSSPQALRMHHCLDSEPEFLCKFSGPYRATYRKFRRSSTSRSRQRNFWTLLGTASTVKITWLKRSTLLCWCGHHTTFPKKCLQGTVSISSVVFRVTFLSNRLKEFPLPQGTSQPYNISEEQLKTIVYSKAMPS